MRLAAIWRLKSVPMNNKNGIPHFEVPAELRAMTEKSMEQARVAFNTFMTAAQQAVSQSRATRRPCKPAPRVSAKKR
jgi:hypothetical protein